MTGRHERPRRRRVGGLGLGTVVRRSGGRQRLASVLLALIAATAVAYLVGSPRLQSTAYDRALGDELRSATQLQRDLTLSLRPQGLTGFLAGQDISTTPGEGIDPPFALVDQAVDTTLGRDRDLVGEATVAAQSAPFSLTPEGDKAGGERPQAVLRVQGGLDPHVTWTTGKPPGDATQTRIVDDTVRRRARVMPVGVSDAVAKGLGVRLGQVLVLRAADPEPGGVRDAVNVVVTGTFSPRDVGDAFWQPEPQLLDVAAIPTSQGGSVRRGAFVLPLESYPALADTLEGLILPDLAPMGAPSLTHTWRYTVREDLTRADASRLEKAAVRLSSSVELTRLPDRPRLVTDVPGLVDRYLRSLTSTSVVTSFASAGITALAVIVLMLTALVATAGRLRELTLLAARGASTREVLTVALAGPMTWGVVGAATGAGLAVVLVDGTTPWQSWLQVAVVVVAPAVAVTLLALGHVRDATTGRSGTSHLVRAARRIVAEVALVALAVLAVVTVRSRGEVISGGQTDWYAALAPVLVSAAAAVVVFRLLPVPLRALSRWAGRGRGYVPFLGLARTSRSSTTSGLPLLALVVGASVLTVLASVFVTIGQQRTESAYLAVGADVRIDAVRVDPQDVAAVASRSGVSAVAPAYVERGAQIAGAVVSTGRQAKSLTVVAVDPATYSSVVAGTPLAVDPPTAKAGEGRVPVWLSDGGAVGDEIDLVLRGARVPATVTLVDPRLARLDTGRRVTTGFVPFDQVAARVPVQPTAIYVRATPAASQDLMTASRRDAASLGELVTGASSARAVVADSAGRSLPAFVTRTYAVAAALASVLAFLAVVLLLVAGRPERRQLLLRLRTMGLPRRAEARLLGVEVLPLLATAVLVGAAVGVAAPVLVSSALDLGAYTTGPRPTLTPLWSVGAASAGAAFVLAVVALAVEQLRARRASLSEHLRGGETA